MKQVFYREWVQRVTSREHRDGIGRNPIDANPPCLSPLWFGHLERGFEVRSVRHFRQRTDPLWVVIDDSDRRVRSELGTKVGGQVMRVDSGWSSGDRRGASGEGVD